MENQEEVSRYEFYGLVLNAIGFLISPILMIWGINTLFETGIAFSFKTWLAGLILIILVRFHIKQKNVYYYPDEYEFDDDQNNDENLETAQGRSSDSNSGKLSYKRPLNNKTKTPSKS